MKDMLFTLHTMNSKAVLEEARRNIPYIDLRDMILDIISNWVYKEKNSIVLNNGIFSDREMELKLMYDTSYILLKRHIELELDDSMEFTNFISNDDEERALDIMLLENSIIIYITKNKKG